MRHVARRNRKGNEAVRPRVPPIDYNTSSTLVLTGQGRQLMKERGNKTHRGSYEILTLIEKKPVYTELKYCTCTSKPSERQTCINIIRPYVPVTVIPTWESNYRELIWSWSHRLRQVTHKEMNRGKIFPNACDEAPNVACSRERCVEIIDSGKVLQQGVGRRYVVGAIEAPAHSEKGIAETRRADEDEGVEGSAIRHSMDGMLGRLKS
ncbi:hypothetical protein DL93DRAFT_2161627 [Clavulina sp. PMI_390]|nr:hypothetical protein DL93DRAFT_2161627 [Clavulina sp. PMI_390]